MGKFSRLAKFNTTTFNFASFNNLDNHVIGCLFQDHQLAISSTHGNFYCMDTRFERSNITDITYAHLHFR